MDITLSEAIRLWRKRRNLSQQELEEKAGVSRNSISMLERGEYNPTVQHLDKIANALELELVISFEAQE
jgi:transcriptional regulator with XRE-family HTH domain